MRLFIFAISLLFLGSLTAQPLSKEEVGQLLDTLGPPEVQLELNFKLAFGDVDTTLLSGETIPLEGLDSSALVAGLGTDSLDNWRYWRLFFDSYEKADLEQAETYFMQAAQSMEDHINKAPNDSFAVQNLANLFVQAENVELAMRTLDYGIERFPGDVDLYRLKYQLLAGMGGDPSQSLAFLDAAINRFPAVPELAFFKFLRGYSTVFQTEKISVEEKAAILMPLKNFKENNPDKVLSEVFWRYGKSFIDFAVVVFKAVEEEEGGDLKKVSEKNLSKEERDALKSNIRYFKKLKKQKALPDAVAHHLLAMQYLILGDSKAALRELEKELAILPPDEQSEAWQSYYMIKLMPNIKDEAYQKKIINQKHADYPEPQDFLILAVLNIRENNLDEAESKVKKALAALPGSEKAAQIAANIALRKGELEVAKSYIERARTINNSSIYTFLLNAVAEGVETNRTASLARVEELLTHLPENEEGLAWKRFLEKED